MADSPADLDRWVTALTSALDLREAGDGRQDVPIGLLLDLTREAAHGIVRPAGPLTTYLVGLAVARGMPVDDAVRHARSAIAAWGKIETAPAE